MNLYETKTLILMAKLLEKAPSFLRDRYFPTNETTDIFSTEKVLVEYQDGSKKAAPFVAPRKGAITMLREGRNMKEYEPANIVPRRVLTLDELQKRNFGEALYSGMTPEQRQQYIMASDLDFLIDSITRRQEAMAAETLLTNGCIMKHIADDIAEGDITEIRFYDEESNPAEYTPSKDWDDPTANILGDIDAMASILTSRGLAASELVVAPDVAVSILNNEQVQKFLDNKGYNMGNVEPVQLPDGATRMARLVTPMGRAIDVICYEKQYTDAEKDENGKISYENKQYIHPGKVVLTAPACGRTLYGAVTQIEQADGAFHTYAAAYVPKYLSNADTNVRTIQVASKPILVPNHKNAFISATVQGEEGEQ